MNIAVIGLGRMGSILVERLIKAGHTVIGYDPNIKAQEQAQEAGAAIVKNLEDLSQHANVFWLMVPAGRVFESTFEKLETMVRPHDIVIDGGNSNFEQSIGRANILADKQCFFLDCGTSGGIRAREHGFCLMVGGDHTAYRKIEPLLKAAACSGGYGYVGPSGAGHYVKMVHNGIEYSLLQSYAEGLNLLRHGHYKELDLAALTHLWNHGSIIRSFILELTQEVLAEDQKLDTISGEVGENLTGRWTLEEAKKQSVSMDLLERSLMIRAWSRQTGGNYATKIVAMLRNKFGGHDIKKQLPEEAREEDNE